VIYLDQNQTSCTNCHAVTTQDGKTVWVCENCGTQNQPDDVVATVAPTQAPVEPVAQETQAAPIMPPVEVLAPEPSPAPIEPAPVMPPVEPAPSVPPVTPVV
jgi:hypothetical protein